MHAIDMNKNYKVSMIKRFFFAESSLAMGEKNLLSIIFILFYFIFSMSLMWTLGSNQISDEISYM